MVLELKLFDEKVKRDLELKSLYIFIENFS
jgi:hypothetical protein